MVRFMPVPRPSTRSSLRRRFVTRVVLGVAVLAGSLVVHPATGHAWVPPLSFVASTSPVGAGGGHIVDVALLAATDTVMVLTEQGAAPGTLDVINPTTGAATTISVGINPVGISVNQTTNKVFVSNGTSSTLSVVDPVAGTVQNVALPGIPVYAPIVDPVANKVYTVVLAPNVATVVEYNAANGQLATFTGPVSGFVLALDAPAHRLYVVGPLSINEMDTQSRTLLRTVPGPNWPTSAVVDTTAHRLLIAANGVIPGNGHIGIVDLTTMTYITSPVHPGLARSISLDAVTHQVVFISGPDVRIVDGGTGAETATIALPGAASGVQPYSLVLDTATRRAIVGSRPWSVNTVGALPVWVIDTANGTLVRSETLFSAQPAPFNPNWEQNAIVGLNTSSHRAFVAVAMAPGLHGYVTSLDPGPSDPTAVTLTGELYSATVSWIAPTWSGTAGTFGTATVRLRDAVSNAVIATQDVPFGTSSATFSVVRRGTYRADVQQRTTSTFTSASVTSATAIVYGAPGQPTNVTLSASTSVPGAATVSWTAPVDDGGSPIIDYDLIVQPTNGASPSSLSVGAATTATFNGLAAGSYRASVAARNSCSGFGVSSDPSLAGTVIGVPGPPTAITASAIGSGVTVSWTAPTRNGGVAINGYRVILQATTGTAPARAFDTTGTVTTASFSVPALGTYRVEVTARSSTYGPSGVAASTVSPPVGSATSGMQTVTRAPIGVVSSSANDGLTVAWAAPPAISSTQPVTAYRLIVLPTTGGEAQSIVVSASVSSTVPPLSSFPPGTNNAYRIAGLSAGAKFVIVSAIVSSSIGSASVPVSATMTGRPSAPAISSVAVSGTSVTLSWAAPSDTGGVNVAALAYDVLATAPGIGPGPVFVQADATSPAIIDLRLPGSYRFFVRARNPSGIGPTSGSTSTIVIP